MENKKFDPVENPSHYTDGNIQCIDAMIEAKGIDAVINFCECNAFKYNWRAGKKDNVIQDLKKAGWYLNKAIELRLDKNA